MPYKDREKRLEHARERNKVWYQQHKEKVIARKQKRQREILDWFRLYKSSLCCMDCGVSHPAVLQFHHRDRTEKSFSISDVAKRATSVKQITNEIKKCDVVCVNCHAKRHWDEKHGANNGLEIILQDQ